MESYTTFGSGSCNRLFLKESWAEAVEAIVTNDRYLALDRSYRSTHTRDIANRLARWGNWRQTDRVQDMNEYTPIVDDLIDNLNQNVRFGNTTPIDRVMGYQLNQIQRALDNCRDINCWERNLRNYYANQTESYLTELFNYRGLLKTGYSILLVNLSDFNYLLIYVFSD